MLTPCLKAESILHIDPVQEASPLHLHLIQDTEAGPLWDVTTTIIAITEMIITTPHIPVEAITQTIITESPTIRGAGEEVVTNLEEAITTPIAKIIIQAQEVDPVIMRAVQEVITKKNAFLTI